MSAGYSRITEISRRCWQLRSRTVLHHVLLERNPFRFSLPYKEEHIFAQAATHRTGCSIPGLRLSRRKRRSDSHRNMIHIQLHRLRHGVSKSHPLSRRCISRSRQECLSTWNRREHVPELQLRFAARLQQKSCFRSREYSGSLRWRHMHDYGQQLTLESPFQISVLAASDFEAEVSNGEVAGASKCIDR